MKLLLDAHALLWWLSGDVRLGRRARAAIVEPTNFVFVSGATAWEIATKRALGKLQAPGDIEDWLAQNRFRPLPIRVGEAVAAAELPLHHRDPFDRLLVAQARLGGMTIVTRDENISKYDVPVLPVGMQA